MSLEKTQQWKEGKNITQRQVTITPFLCPMFYPSF